MGSTSPWCTHSSYLTVNVTRAKTLLSCGPLRVDTTQPATGTSPTKEGTLLQRRSPPLISVDFSAKLVLCRDTRRSITQATIGKSMNGTFAATVISEDETEKCCVGPTSQLRSASEW